MTPPCSRASVPATAILVSAGGHVLRAYEKDERRALLLSDEGDDPHATEAGLDAGRPEAGTIVGSRTTG